jgi:acetyl esterase
MTTDTLDYTTEDIVCLRHPGRDITMRFFRPAGAGPHPAVVDMHGGGWCESGVEDSYDRCAYFAAHGIAAAALDFRHGDDGYPTSLVDINGAVRFVKANAARLGVDPARMALVGQSSGGHLAMLATMRPDDARYGAATPEGGADGVDASVACVAMAWPVINPVSRYRHALRARAETGAKWVSDLPERHERYWKTEDAMAEGSPMLILERGEAVRTPPAIWVQPENDPVHDYRDPDAPAAPNEPQRFVEAYRKAGGEIELAYIPKENRESPSSWGPLADFLRGRFGL